MFIYGKHISYFAYCVIYFTCPSMETCEAVNYCGDTNVIQLFRACCAQQNTTQ